MSQDDVPTPRHSSAFQRAGAFRELARDLAERLEREALKHEKVLGATFDLKKAQKLRALARKSWGLVDSFSAWFRPGAVDYNQRLDDIAAYQQLVSDAKDLGVLTYDR